MSKMEEGRNGPGFTAAVIIALELILGFICVAGAAGTHNER
jgi:hypothetical protein